MHPRIAILIVILAAGCGPSTEGVKQHIDDLNAQAAELDKKIGEQEARLTEVNEEIEQAHAELEQAKKEAEHAKCCAEKHQIIAKILTNRTECAKRIADYEICMAKNEGRTGKGTLVGCLLGGAATLLTSGAAAPTLIGCGGGLLAGKASHSSCPLPPCAEHIGEIVEQTMEAMGYEEWPPCACEPIPIDALMDAGESDAQAE